MYMHVAFVMQVHVSRKKTSEQRVKKCFIHGKLEAWQGRKTDVISMYMYMSISGTVASILKIHVFMYCVLVVRCLVSYTCLHNDCYACYVRCANTCTCTCIH